MTKTSPGRLDRRQSCAALAIKSSSPFRWISFGSRLPAALRLPAGRLAGDSHVHGQSPETAPSVHSCRRRFVPRLPEAMRLVQVWWWVQLCWLMAQASTQTSATTTATAKPLPKIHKCCNQNEFFDVAGRACRLSPPDIRLSEYEIDPVILPESDELDGVTQDPLLNYEDEVSSPLEPQFEWAEGRGQLPRCNGPMEELHFLYNPANVAEYAPFQLIFKQNVSANSSSHLSVAPIDESLLYDDFCVDWGFRKNQIIDTAASFGFGRPLVAPAVSYDFLGTVVVYCQPVEKLDCEQRPCFQTCCPFAHVVDAATGDCVVPDEDQLWRPQLFDPVTEQPVGPQQLAKKNRIFYSRTPSCYLQTYDSRTEHGHFKLYSDGHIAAGGGRYNYTQFCIQDVRTEDNQTGAVTFHERALVCAPDDPWSQGYLRWKAHFDLTVVPSLVVLSVVCLIVLFVYFWRTRRAKLFGSMMLSTVATLTVFYILVAIVKFSGLSLMVSSPKTCTALGFMVQFSYMSSFFWLTAMSMDIWRNFRSLRVATAEMRLPGRPARKYGCLESRFKWYALLAWGLPLLVTLATVIVQMVGHDGLILPDVGSKQCFFGSDIAILLYLHALTGPALSANLLFFISFVYNFCWGVWAKPKNTMEKNVRRKQQSRLKTVIKMFFVMGIIWSTDVISWGLSWAYGDLKVYKYTALADVINALQGCIMFMVLYFDRQNLRRIRTRLGLRPKLNAKSADRQPTGARSMNVTLTTEQMPSTPSPAVSLEMRQKHPLALAEGQQ